MKHGDGVKDIAFEVEDCDYIVQVRLGPPVGVESKARPALCPRRVPLSQGWRTLLCEGRTLDSQ